MQSVTRSSPRPKLPADSRLQVPKHLKEGDSVVIDTRTGDYVGKEH